MRLIALKNMETDQQKQIDANRGTERNTGTDQLIGVEAVKDLWYEIC